MPVNFQDYYKTLGVTKDAPQDEIKKAFRDLARKHHPDVAKGKQDGGEKFKTINEAYEVIGKPENRKKYDALGMNWKTDGATTPGTAPGGQEFHFSGTGFSDFFEQHFGGGGMGDLFGDAAGANRGQQWKAKGQDIEGDLLVTLREVITGSERAISLRRVDSQTGTSETETIRIRVPRGVLAGQIIRVAGKGGAGFNGGPPGDMFLRTRFAKDPNFRTLKTDLYYDLPLAPWEAVLGITLPVPTLHEPVTLKIPPNSRAGQKLRVRGRGLPGPGDKQGDLIVALTIEMPPESSVAEIEAWSALGTISTFNPRKSSA
jgi:curved DNA-binding protein